MPEPGSNAAFVPMLFAEPRKDGKWVLKEGVLHFKDGHLHKIETVANTQRSGEGFGITITFYSCSPLTGTAPQTLHGTIQKQVFQNGRLISTEDIEADAEVVVE